MMHLDLPMLSESLLVLIQRGIVVISELTNSSRPRMDIVALYILYFGNQTLYLCLQRTTFYVQGSFSKSLCGYPLIP